MKYFVITYHRKDELRGRNRELGIEAKSFRAAISQFESVMLRREEMLAIKRVLQ